MKTALVAMALLLSVCSGADSAFVELESGYDNGASYPTADVEVTLVPLVESGAGWRVDATVDRVVVRSDDAGRAELKWDPARPYRIQAVYRVSDDAACFWMGSSGNVLDGSAIVTVPLLEVCE